MSYKKPDEIPEKQNQIYITLHTIDVVRQLEHELQLVGLRIASVTYYKNEYCGERIQPCGCPHWFKVKIENFHRCFYEVNVWFWVCKRKRVYEIRFCDEDGNGFVEKDFWINGKERTQEAGTLIHSWGLKQAANDIKIAHQAAEIKHYQSKCFTDYYAKLFRKEGKE